MTLTEFLLARIAEDEAVAQAATPGPWKTFADAEGGVWAADGYGMAATGCAQQNGDHIARHDPARVLARCKADRQLLELHGDNGSIPGKYELRCYACDSDYPCDTLKIMALPYAEHPDYHRGWRS